MPRRQGDGLRLGGQASENRMFSDAEPLYPPESRISSLSLVRYRSNDYSVPTQYGHRQISVKGYAHEVVIACASEVIAQHERSYDREVAHTSTRD